jgi:DNA invertase Pin-like site-specific DNA recombinase
VGASYARFSSNLQQVESIADQQRRCHEYAAQINLTIGPELQFADEAISGTKLARDGLDRLLAASRQHRFSTLLLDNLSRLARESIISLPILKELVEIHGIRVISVSEGFDTSRGGWEMLAALYSLQHEKFVKDLGSAVFRGQEGVVLTGYSVGDMCFGYKSEPVPGTEVKRRGRHGRPRTRYVIELVAAAWVVQIFQWFALEKRSMRWIAHELTRLGAPKDHRATTLGWHHDYVRRVLCRSKYIGRWPWGKKANKRNPFTGKVSQTERPSQDCDKWERHLPELRIISDGLWDAAQRRLAEVGGANSGRRRRNGKLAGSAPGQSNHSPRHLLEGLIQCGYCGLNFQVSGAHGDYLGCRGYVVGRCACGTHAPRSRTEQQILQAIGEQVLADPRWRQEVQDFLRRRLDELNQQLPSQLAQARKQLCELNHKIERLIDLIEDGAAPEGVQRRLDQRRAEKQVVERRVGELERDEWTRFPEPTEAWVVERFQALDKLLRGSGPAAALALRNLVGGQIVVHKVERPDRCRHYLRASFKIRTANLLQAICNQPTLSESGETSDTRDDEIVVDLRELSPWEKNANQIKQLWDQGLQNEDIAERLHLNRNQVTRAIASWHLERGLIPPDGRTRRWQFARESRALDFQPYPIERR